MMTQIKRIIRNRKIYSSLLESIPPRVKYTYIYNYMRVYKIKIVGKK